MRHLYITLQLLHWSALVHASSVFESIPQVPRGWNFVRNATGKETLKLTVSMKQQNLDKFYENLEAVSNPGHPQYGMHYQRHELRSLLRPSEESSAAVLRWLQDNSIMVIEDDFEYVQFQTDVSSANELLGTQFSWYFNTNEGNEVLRTTEYSLPETIAEHVNFVQPTTRFGSQKPLSSYSEVMQESELLSNRNIRGIANNKVAVNVTNNCNFTITPRCLKSLYNMNFTAKPNSGNTVGYTSFLGESAKYSDTVAFQKAFAQNTIGQNSNTTSAEGNLDNQYIIGLSGPIPVTEFITGGRGLLVPDGDSPTQADNMNEPYLDFLQALLKLENDAIPNTISISYGEDEQSIPVSYAMQVCNMFAQLGARGKSVLIASGDSGTGDFCLSNDGKNTTVFQPQFPSTCPYVTSVGATAFIQPEQAVFFSSGGFSNFWAQPSYQEKAVADYLSKIGSKNSEFFNKSGRAFPDVAAQGQAFHVVDQGIETLRRGTSASAPVFASVIATLNSARVEKNLSTLGFLNPWLYGNGLAGLNDVMVGASTGCNGLTRFNRQPNGSPVIPGASWNATLGWDAVSGLGTPDFAKLLALSSSAKL